MVSNRPYLLFTSGLLFTLSISLIYYFFLPEFEYYDGSFLIYGPEATNLEVMSSKKTVSNQFLLWKYTNYTIIYWLSAIFLYFIIGKIKNINLRQAYIWTHFILSVTGFTLLIYLNKYILANELFSSHISDFFINGKITKEQFFELQKQALWYSSLGTKTSIIGVILIFLGSLFFIIGIVKGWRKRNKQVETL